MTDIVMKHKELGTVFWGLQIKHAVLIEKSGICNQFGGENMVIENLICQWEITYKPQNCWESMTQLLMLSNQ